MRSNATTALPAERKTVNSPYHTTRTLVTTIATLVLALAASSSSAADQQREKLDIKWQSGPGVAGLQKAAEIKLPAGYKFADGEDTRRILRASGEPTSGQEMGMLKPDEGRWSVFFDFSGDGYVKDDDKDKLDADKLLKAIIKGNDYGNKEREKMGVAPLKIIGWEQKPAYDPVTHNLEWAIRAESEGHQILNYNTRLLGRKGVMEVVLVCAPDDLAQTLPTFKELLSGYSYKPGETYAEYRQGDKLAKYGLAALVTGGAVAVAAKTGLLASIVLFFKKGWKLVIIGVVAIGAFIKRLVTGDRARPNAE